MKHSFVGLIMSGYGLANHGDEAGMQVNFIIIILFIYLFIFLFIYLLKLSGGKWNASLGVCP